MSEENSKNSLPAMPWYWGDWFKDPGVQSLPRDTRCVWFEMLGRMWESSERGVLLINGNIPSEKQLSMMLGFGDNPGDNPGVNLHINTLVDNGVCSLRKSDGALLCRRMVRDEEKRLIHKNNGKKGGNPLIKSHSVNPSVNPVVSKISNEGVNPEVIQITEDENENEDSSFSSLSSLNSSSFQGSSFDQIFSSFWLAYPRKEERESTKEIFLQILTNKKATPHRLIDGANFYNAHCLIEYADDYPHSQFIKKPKNWLNDQNWKDDWKEKIKTKHRRPVYGPQKVTNEEIDEVFSQLKGTLK